MITVPQWVSRNLGKRVVLRTRVGDFPAGRTGLLVSIQSGWQPDDRGVSHPGQAYATVSFETENFWEENVPFHALRPMEHRG